MLESIKFHYEVADDQSEARRWSYNHVKYDCVIKYKGRQYSFPYFCGRNVDVELKEVMDCLLLDAFSVEGTYLTDFMAELGYTDREEARKAYNACLRTNKAMFRLFTSDEISKLQDEINEQSQGEGTSSPCFLLE